MIKNIIYRKLFNDTILFVKKPRHLPRLPEEHYQGMVAVHWTLSIAERKTGWLNDFFHWQLREALLHMSMRYHCLCPVYCLMPDHMHILLRGYRQEARLLPAIRFVRRETSVALRSAFYQKQAYDHVLRDRELTRSAFAAVIRYILENPLRAKLCSKPEDYPYSGAILPGYPRVDVHDESYWDHFWRIFHLLAETSHDQPEATGRHALTSAAT